MRFIKLSVGLLSFILSSLAYAIAPVVDAYGGGETTSPSQSNAMSHSVNSTSDNLAAFSLEQRVTILERQIANLNPLLVQEDDLQQQEKELRGKLENQQHRLEYLEKQLHSQSQYPAEKHLTSQQVPHSHALPEKPIRQSLTNANASLAPTAHPDNIPRGNSATQEKIPINPSDSKLTPSSTMPTTAAAERAYQADFQLLKNKQYAAAIEGFEDFIKKYPTDLNVSNANYFLGQLYLLQGLPDQSIRRFNQFINRGGQDARIPDALLQLGLAYFAKGDKNIAIETFEKTIQQYPDTKAAESARARLQQFKAMISSATLSARNSA